MFNVRTAGAVGDGKTDDTAAICRARDEAGTAGLYFPPGIYRNRGLTANVARQCWELAPGATIARPDRDIIHAITVTADEVTITGGTIDMTGAGFAAVMVGSGRSWVTVEGVHVIGGASGVRVKGATGPASSSIRVRECRIEGTTSHAVYFNWQTVESEVVDCVLVAVGPTADGVLLANGSTGCRVTGNRITATDMGVEAIIGSDDVTVSDNRISSGYYGISISGTPRALVGENRITTTGPTAHGIEVVDSPHTTVSRNTIRDVTGDAIRLNSNAGGTNDHTLVEHNQIITPAGAAVDSRGAGTSSHITVDGNVIRDAGANCYTIQNDIDDAHWLIAGNSLTRTTVAGPGMNVNGRQNNVVDNTIYHDPAIPVSAGIAIRLACDDSNVSDNTVVGNGKIEKGIQVTRGHADVSVRANRVSGTTSVPIANDSGSPTVVIDGNELG